MDQDDEILATERMIKEATVRDDGRYLIYYRFESGDQPAGRSPAGEPPAGE